MRQDEHETGSAPVFLRGRLGVASTDAEGFACNMNDRYGAPVRPAKFRNEREAKG